MSLDLQTRQARLGARFVYHNEPNQPEDLRVL